MYEQPTYNSKRSHKLLLLESAVVSQPPCEKFKFAEMWLNLTFYVLELALSNLNYFFSLYVLATHM